MPRHLSNSGKRNPCALGKEQRQGTTPGAQRDSEIPVLSWEERPNALHGRKNKFSKGGRENRENEMDTKQGNVTIKRR